MDLKTVKPIKTTSVQINNHDSLRSSEYLKLEEQYSELMFNFKFLLKENNELKRKISLISTNESKSECNTSRNVLSTCTQTETSTNKLSDIASNTLETVITSQQEAKDNDDNIISYHSSSICPDDVERPCVLFPGHPFSLFNVDALDQEIIYSHSLESRQLKYFGDLPYSYGKITHGPCSVPENSYLSKIINHVSSVFPKYQFNSVLITKFENGKSFLPMHSDNENVIHPASTILTVSLGETRAVKFQLKDSASSPECFVNISNGDVYAMSCKSQSVYKHGIPKDYSKGCRISLTFRLISPDNSETSLDSVEQFLHNLDCSQVSSPVEPTPIAPRREQSYASVLASSVPSQQQQPSSPNPNEQSEIDTIYISSSMFRELSEEKLSSREHKSSVLYFPGATASGILRQLPENNKFNSIDPVKVKNVFLMCGTNDIDTILNIKRWDHNNINVGAHEINYYKLQRSLSDINDLISYIHQTFESAKLNIINILPRNSRLRNEVINNINSNLKSYCSNSSYLEYINTEYNINLFSNVNGFRKNDFFKSAGSDNVHLSREGVVRLGKHLKYLTHN